MFGRIGQDAKPYALCSSRAKIARRRKIAQVYCRRDFAFSPVFFVSIFILLGTKVVFFFFAIIIPAHFCCVCLSFLQLFVHK